MTKIKIHCNSTQHKQSNAKIKYEIYSNLKLICHCSCVLCSIPRLFVYLRMQMSTSKQYCGIAFEPGYLWVSPVLRLYLCALRLYSAC